MDSVIIQYIILALLFLFACFYIFKLLRKNFSSKKFKSGKPGCDQDCGCS